MIIHYALLGAVLFGLAITFAYCFITGISPVPTTRTAKRAILDLLPEDPSGTIFELGAGWGTLAFPLARRYPHRDVIAFELSPMPWLFMTCRRWLTGPRNLRVRRLNFLNVELASAGLIVCYLFPRAMENLAPKFKEELINETVVISNTFELPGWIPSRVATVEDPMCPEIFLYRIPPSRS